MIILDTNVISELMRAEPDQAVLRWMSEQRLHELVEVGKHQPCHCERRHRNRQKREQRKIGASRDRRFRRATSAA